MSAIVEGVSMVRHCGECELNKLNWDRCHQILRGCPIIGEIPDKHGRLIDTDILLDTIRYGAEVRDFCDKKCKSQDCRNCIIKSVYKIIKEALTIIEAEVSE